MTVTERERIMNKLMWTTGRSPASIPLLGVRFFPAGTTPSETAYGRMDRQTQILLDRSNHVQWIHIYITTFCVTQSNKYIETGGSKNHDFIFVLLSSPWSSSSWERILSSPTAAVAGKSHFVVDRRSERSPPPTSAFFFTFFHFLARRLVS